MTLFALDRVTVRLDGREVLHGVSLELREGSFAALIGPNGAGKSTLLRAAAGLIPAEGGISLAGAPLARLSSTARARAAAFLAQEREVAWPVTVKTLVGLGRFPHRGAMQPATAEDRAHVERAMERMDVARLRARPATELSGGERARALIARALAQDTPLLLADEPAAGLDPAHQITLMEVFAELAADGRGVLASMHDLGLAARWCDRLVLLHEGRIVADGTPEAVLTPENLARVYGIEAHIGRANGGLVVQPLSRTTGR